MYRCIRGGSEGGGEVGGVGGGEMRLLAECSYVGKTVSMSLSTFSHYVVVGDLLQSVAFLVYSPASPPPPPYHRTRRQRLGQR